MSENQQKPVPKPRPKPRPRPSSPQEADSSSPSDEKNAAPPIPKREVPTAPSLPPRRRNESEASDTEVMSPGETNQTTNFSRESSSSSCQETTSSEKPSTVPPRRPKARAPNAPKPTKAAPKPPSVSSLGDINDEDEPTNYDEIIPDELREAAIIAAAKGSDALSQESNSSPSSPNNNQPYLEPDPEAPEAYEEFKRLSLQKGATLDPSLATESSTDNLEDMVEDEEATAKSTRESPEPSEPSVPSSPTSEKSSQQAEDDEKEQDVNQSDTTKPAIDSNPSSNPESVSSSTATSRSSSPPKKKRPSGLKRFFSGFSKKSSNDSFNKIPLDPNFDYDAILEKVRPVAPTIVQVTVQTSANNLSPREQTAPFLNIEPHQKLDVILMDTNAPGIWVCRNESEEIGLVRNIHIVTDPDSVRQALSQVPTPRRLSKTAEGIPVNVRGTIGVPVVDNKPSPLSEGDERPPAVPPPYSANQQNDEETDGQAVYSSLEEEQEYASLEETQTQMNESQQGPTDTYECLHDANIPDQIEQLEPEQPADMEIEESDLVYEAMDGDANQAVYEAISEIPFPQKKKHAYEDVTIGIPSSSTSSTDVPAPPIPQRRSADDPTPSLPPRAAPAPKSRLKSGIQDDLDPASSDSD